MRKAVAIGRWAIPLLFSWNLAAAESAPSTSASGCQDKGETLVFVGRLISIQEVLPEPCPPNANRSCLLPRFDKEYVARYKVLERVTGRFDTDEVQFNVYSHRGFPAMALHPEALLFVWHRGEQYCLHRYQGYAVHPTTDGGWAHCGEINSRTDDDAPTTGFGPQSFASDFGSAQQLDNDADQGRFPRDAFTVENDRIVCPRGLALADLYEAVRSGLMKARCAVLPPFAEAPADH
ncbi:MAG: hypothetical protein J0L88_03570 [Xanthomonadales bacterium]|nr:hypothetical protein [Xanthomonadales bacterium]